MDVKSFDFQLAASLRSKASPVHPFCGSRKCSRHVEYAAEYFTPNATSADMGRVLLMLCVYCIIICGVSLAASLL